MKVLQLALLVGMLALVGIGVDTVTAADADGATSGDVVEFRVCAPPVDVGPFPACSIEVG